MKNDTPVTTYQRNRELREADAPVKRIPAPPTMITMRQASVILAQANVVRAQVLKGGK